MTKLVTSAKGKLALALVSGLAVFGATNVLGAPKPSFTVAASPATQTVTAGQNTSYGITIDRKNKHAAAVALSVTGLPAYATGTFTPSTVPSSGTTSSLGVKTNQGGTTPPGTYTLNISGTGGGVTSSTTAKLVVVSASQANFALTATPSQSVISDDDSVSHEIGITRTGGFTGAVTLSASGLPGKVGAAFAPNPVSGNTAMVVFTSGKNPKAGTYPVTITGTGSGLTRSTTITLTVEEKKPFGISGNAAHSLVPGASVPLDLALTNPSKFTLKVTELEAAVDPQTSSSVCDGGDNFSVDPIPASRYPISLPGNSTRTLSQLGVSTADMPTVVMNDLLTVNQDGCKGVTIYFNYTGAATK